MRKFLLIIVAAAGFSGYAASALADCMEDRMPVKQSVMNETKPQTPKPVKPGS
jgi:hypothetical protein